MTQISAATSSTGAPRSRTASIAGTIISGLAVLFLLFDAVIHLLVIPPVVQAFTQLGYPVSVSVPLGIIMLVCLALYVVPRTSPLGAVLITGYLGGAVSIHVRVSDPLFSHTLFPVYVAMMVWGGLYLRDQRVRALISANT